MSCVFDHEIETNIKCFNWLHSFTFRPTLADVQKIGFFSLDRSSQTDVTEIVDLKEMTEVLQILLQVTYLLLFLGVKHIVKM